MSKIVTEHLQSEDPKKRPDKPVLVYFLSFLCLFVLFSLFWNFGAGGEKGAGEGNIKGEGAGTGLGNGMGLGSTGDGQGKGEEGKSLSESSPKRQSDEHVDSQEEGVGNSNSQEIVAKTAEKNPEEPKQHGDIVFKSEKSFSPFVVKISKKVPLTPSSNAPSGMRSGNSGGGSSTGKPPGTGDISFRIYWSPRMHDIDLHVIDPNGHELFFQNKSCRCHGELDVDDTNSGGPENIFWPPGRAPHGRYRFYVVYYDGVGPKNVILEVRKGQKIFKTYKIRLTQKNDKSKVFIVNFE